MYLLQRFKKVPSFFYVISHERSGTHFLINCIKLNTSKQLKYQSVGEWFGPFENSKGRLDHIREKFRSLNKNNHYILKSHCDRNLFEECYPKGKIIYIFRDYRDVLTSYYHFIKGGYLDWARKHNAGIDPVWFSEFSEFIRKPVPDFLRYNYSLHGNFSTPIERWENHIFKWIVNPLPDMRIITYNQLYQDTETVTRQLIDWLNLPAESQFTLPDLKTHYSIAPRKGTIGDWKNHFSSEDLDYLNAAVSDKLPLLNDFSWQSTTMNL